jgi:hypothetical protein
MDDLDRKPKRFGIYHGANELSGLTATGSLARPMPELLAEFDELSDAKEFMVSLAEELGYFIAEAVREKPDSE